MNVHSYESIQSCYLFQVVVRAKKFVEGPPVTRREQQLLILILSAAGGICLLALLTAILCKVRLMARS